MKVNNDFFVANTYCPIWSN